MSRVHSNETPVTFHDVAACFSQEQWKLLHEWQKELYRNVMKEIHQALTSLGPLIATSVFSLRAQESEDLCCMDHQDSERNCFTQPARNVSITQTVSYGIKEEVEDDFMDNENCERGDHIKILTGLPSFGTKTDSRSTSTFRPGGRAYGTGQSSGRTDLNPTVSYTINGEENHFSEDHQDCKIIGSIKNSNAASGAKGQEWSWNLEKYAEKRAQGITLNGKNKRQAFQRSDKEENSNTQTHHPVMQRHCERNILEHSTEFKIDTNRSINSAEEQRTLKEKKIYSNTNCFPSFSQRVDLPINQQKTKEDLPYACSECGDRFVKRTTYGTHSRDDEAYECASCGKSVNVSSNSILQEEFHVGERTHTCMECGKSFIQRSALTNHQRTHTGEKPYTCIDCGKCFSDRSNYIRHQRTHTGEKPFKCSVCGKCYSDHSNYTRHQRSHK